MIGIGEEELKLILIIVLVVGGIVVFMKVLKVTGAGTGKTATPPAAAPGTRRYCSKCGGGVERGDAFCSNCGQSIGASQ